MFDIMMMIAFITIKSSLVPLIEGNVVVKLQVCDAESSPFLLREIHLGGREGQGARKENGVRGHRLPSPPCLF